MEPSTYVPPDAAYYVPPEIIRSRNIHTAYSPNKVPTFSDAPIFIRAPKSTHRSRTNHNHQDHPSICKKCNRTRNHKINRRTERGRTAETDLILETVLPTAGPMTFHPSRQQADTSSHLAEYIPAVPHRAPEDEDQTWRKMSSAQTPLPAPIQPQVLAREVPARKVPCREVPCREVPCRQNADDKILCKETTPVPNYTGDIYYCDDTTSEGYTSVSAFPLLKREGRVRQRCC